LPAEGSIGPIERPNAAERDRLRRFAQQQFTKEAHNAGYRQLLSAMTA
jgi:hypothetical protein